MGWALNSFSMHCVEERGGVKVGIHVEFLPVSLLFLLPAVRTPGRNTNSSELWQQEPRMRGFAISCMDNTCS
jgi:hypothetical protein